MRNEFAALTLALLFVSPANAQSKESDREHEGLKGPVKTVVYEVAKLRPKAGKLEEAKRELKRETNYDEAGNLTREIIPGPLRHRAYGYDGEGNRYDRHSKLALPWTPTEGDFRSRAKITRVVPGYPRPANSPNTAVIPATGFSIFKTVFRHNGAGRRVEEVRFEPDRELYFLIERYVYVYDIHNNRKETLVYDSDNKLSSKLAYTYDTSGNLMERSEHKPNGSLVGKESYLYVEFDERGNWTKMAKSEWVEKDGKSFFDLKEMTYRTITYY